MAQSGLYVSASSVRQPGIPAAAQLQHVSKLLHLSDFSSAKGVFHLNLGIYALVVYVAARRLRAGRP